MSHLKIHALLAVTACLVFSPVFGAGPDEGIFPDWVRSSTAVWINGEISDSEFQALLEDILKRQILPREAESKEIHSGAAEIMHDSEPYEKNSSETIPTWARDRAQWWIAEKITDAQFLQTIHRLAESGYLGNDLEKDTLHDVTLDKGLEGYLLSNKEVLDVTRETIWRIFSTEYESDEAGRADSVKIMFRDITRIYEPVFYKFKIPTMSMQIFEFGNENDLHSYWNSFDGTDKHKIFDSAYLTGRPNEHSECLFNYTSEGAVTSCIYDTMIVQVIIFDQYGKHFNYDTAELVLDETEPTSRFLGEILKKISSDRHQTINHPLQHSLQRHHADENTRESTNKTQTAESDPENSVISGVKNFSCTRDDFGLVTVSGQYHNDGIKRAKVSLGISFLDVDGSVLGKTSAIFYDLKEFESKRFLGHSKWDENFSTCKLDEQPVPFSTFLE